MEPTDEELLHAFYGGDPDALQRLSERHRAVLGQVANAILRARTGSALQAAGEWDIAERLRNVWVHILGTGQVPFGRWPNQRLSGLTWVIHILSLEMDRHLGFQPPF